MLLKCLRFSRVICFTTYHNVLLSLVVGAGNYRGIVTFNIKLILRIIRYPHNNMCFLKASYDIVNY